MSRVFAVAAVIALAEQVAALVLMTRPVVGLAAAGTLVPHLLAAMILARGVADARQRSGRDTVVATFDKFRRKAVVFIFWGGLLVVATVTAPGGSLGQRVALAANLAFHLGAFVVQGSLLRTANAARVGLLESGKEGR